MNSKYSNDQTISDNRFNRFDEELLVFVSLRTAGSRRSYE